MKHRTYTILSLAGAVGLGVAALGGANLGGAPPMPRWPN